MRQLPRRLPPPYVPPEGLPLESNGLGGAAAQLLRFGETSRDAGDGEHPPTVDPEDPIGAPAGSRLEDRYALGEILGQFDRRALLRVVRVSSRRENGGHSSTPAGIDSRRRLTSGSARQAIDQSSRHQRQHHLRLRI